MEENNLTPEQVVEKLDSLFTEKMENVPTIEDITSLKSELDSVKGMESKTQEIEKQIAKFEGKLEAMSEKAVQPEIKPLTIGQAMSKTYADNLDEVKSVVEKGGKMNLDVKNTTITGNYAGQFNLTDYDAQVDRIVRKRYGIMDIVNRGTTDSKFVTYVQQTGDVTSKYVAEGNAKVMGEPSWEEVSEEVKKIAGYVKVSKEMLSDLSFMQSEINGELVAQLTESIEDSLLNGVGGAQITGILQSGIAGVNVGTFGGQIPSANISDVLRVAKGNVESENFTPTHVVLNPADITALHLTKSSTGEYTYPMFVPADGQMRVADMIVVSSNYIAQDTFLVADMSQCNVRMREDINLQVGLDQDDFTKNMVTILAEARLVLYIKNNVKKKAFVTGSIADTITLLQAP